MASGVNFDAAIAGLQKGVEGARDAGAQIAKHTTKVEPSSSSSSSGGESGKGSIIDVKA